MHKKGADQLHINCAADQHVCLCYIDSTFTLLPKSEISRLLPSSVAVQPCLCLTWWETPNTGFLKKLLISEASALYLASKGEEASLVFKVRLSLEPAVYSLNLLVKETGVMVHYHKKTYLLTFSSFQQG